MRHSIDMSGLTIKDFVANSRIDTTYDATIQNNTGQSLTITVTNQNLMDSAVTAVFDTPAGGALVIASGAMGRLSEPYVGWKMTLAGAASAGETIDIMEAG